MPHLFAPISLRSLTVRNRIWLAPMCQYSAVDGVPGDWHLVNLGARAAGGFGLLLTEASAVTPDGRISPEDAGIWNDEQAAAWQRIVDFVHARGAAIGIQLAHAGRKASTYRPWAAAHGSVPLEAGGWVTSAPSALPYEGYAVPQELSVDGLHEITDAFVAAAERSVAAGFDTLEIHAAHGYLLHQLLSPLSNHRTDGYGGPFEHRIRLLVEVVDAVRAVIPDTMPLMVRISGTDWIDGGWDVTQSTRLTAVLAEHGVDVIDVSSGGNAPASIPVGPGYQVPLAAEVRRGARMVTGAVGLITEPDQAEAILAAGEADAVLLARAALREPTWPLRAAHELGVPVDQAGWPDQYLRGAWPASA